MLDVKPPAVIEIVDSENHIHDNTDSAQKDQMLQIWRQSASSLQAYLHTNTNSVIPIVVDRSLQSLLAAPSDCKPGSGNGC
jgi:hypothetical protein